MNARADDASARLFSHSIPVITEDDDDDNNVTEHESPLNDDAQPESASTQLPSLGKRPQSRRSSTDPSPSLLLQGDFNSNSTSRPSSSHRNRSPYSRTHLRSRSSGAPQMTRAHSSPAPHNTNRGLELTSAALSPSSPMRSPVRQRSPLRPQDDSNHNPPQRSPVWFETTSGSAIESIQEDSELDIRPRSQPSQLLPMHPLPRSSSLRRRPASPLHAAMNNATTSASFPVGVMDQNASLNTSHTPSASNSPSLGPQRFNEAYPSLHHYASSSSFSSIPSTPTSQRSRSPSISSLDTIEDVPDLESEAIEAERIERLKLEAERAERAERGEEGEEDNNTRRRGSLDVPRGFGFSRGGNREKKRWSVCGGERRADLDLETIWED